ncbi:B-box zinc finger protein 21-like [Trifolium pratense]|uniref:B-box zinc finger protein 21-like n=1 Tax=Trifolium pratense TaxID=57577 RepID=UPI001E697D6D|nr:B-box zinc finger protein 21-like [Trifolium pratense]
MVAGLLITVPYFPFHHLFICLFIKPIKFNFSQSFLLSLLNTLLTCSKIVAMKIQCDVCSKNEASLFCTADEAALCTDCDHRVHHANKLASKHHRLSLHNPSPKQHPLCDICQERRAFVLCKQDRAILCKDCDSSIHSVNELTEKHDRFLLTGVKLSTTNSSSSSSSTTTSTKPSSAISISKSIVVPSSSSSLVDKSTTPSPKSVEDGSGGSTISQYLIETLPGWQVDDFLDSSSAPFAFYKGDESFEENLDSFFPNNNLGIWVPQAPPPSLFSSSQIMMGQSETKKGSSNNKSHMNKSRLRDDGNNIFTVPQISPVSNPKRTRYLW